MHRRLRTWLVVSLLAVPGCGDFGRAADSYRVQRGLWRALRAEQVARLSPGKPDSTRLLALRENFLRAVREVPETADATGAPGRRTEQQALLLRVLGRCEIQAARLAIEAGRPDLALERCQAMESRAEGDTATTRQLDILITGSLQRLGRHDDAIQVMKSMLVRYPPGPPDSAGVEDFILDLPGAIVRMRRSLGDEAGAALELREAERYFRGLIQGGGLEPELETGVRIRLVEALIEQGAPARTLVELDSLEAQARRVRGMDYVIPEAQLTRARVRALTGAKPQEAIALLQGVAHSYPTSPVAAPALFEAATVMERIGRFEDARRTYETVSSSYPDNSEVAASALFRQAMLEERAGRWEEADLILKSLPVRYPQTGAAAQSPIAIAEHYARKGNREGIQTALRSAIRMYENMIRADSTAVGVPRLRWNLFRCLVGVEEYQDAFSLAEAMDVRHRGNPFAARALVEAAKLADNKKLTDSARSLYLRFLGAYPDSPEAERAKARVRALGGQG